MIPLERELRERAAWFVRLRWLAAAGIAAGAWGAAHLLGGGFEPLPLYLVAGAVAAYNAVFLAIGRRQPAEDPAGRIYRRTIYAQIGLDWVAVVCLVYYCGGVQSPAPLAFAFHLIIGAILLSRLACFVQAAAASLLLALLATMEWGGWWPPPLVPSLAGVAPCSAGACLFRWAALSVFLAVTAYLTTSIAGHVRQREVTLFESRRTLERFSGEMEALVEVGRVVNATLDLDQVLGTIAERGARLMGVKACSIRLLEEDGRHLRIGAAYGLSDRYLEKGRVAVDRSGIDAEALAGTTVQVRDATRDPRFQYAEEARQEGIRAVLCAPLQAKGRAIGCIRVYAAQEREFTSQEVTFLRNLANLGAVAIENARTYADLRTLSEERAWSARVTHHQLRAPLAAARNMLDAVRYAGPLTDQQADFLDRCGRRLDELLLMVRDLLDLAAAERPLAGRPAAPVPLAACLEAALSGGRDRAESKGVRLEAQLAAGAAALADADDIERIFSNLLDNAVKYTPAGGSVRFTAEVSDGRLVAAVQDTGIGIAPADRERVFQGFYRTEAARSTGQVGTGLGLSIVSRLVKRWGGHIELDSGPGQGSRFTVQLPAAPV